MRTQSNPQQSWDNKGKLVKY